MNITKRILKNLYFRGVYAFPPKHVKASKVSLYTNFNSSVSTENDSIEIVFWKKKNT